MQSTEQLDLEAIRGRAEHATPGPWTLEQSEWPGVMEPGGCWVVADWGEWMGPFKADRNAEFISHAREDIPALLTALAAERDRADRAEAARDAHEKNLVDTIDSLYAAEVERDRLAGQISTIKQWTLDANSCPEFFDVVAEIVGTSWKSEATA